MKCLGQLWERKLRKPKQMKNKFLIILVFSILILITILTQYYGSTDIRDYSNVAKFFSEDSAAKVRNTHSYLFGFLHFPFVSLFKNFFIFKITSLIFLSLIIYSIYIISKKNKKALWLILLSPIIWYMAPWTSPIQLAALLFLWAYYFIEKYNQTEKLSYLFYSGLFIGLSWGVWDTIFYLGLFLTFVFLFNKKLYHCLYFILFVMIGLMPRLILDYFLFNFPFYTIIKNIFAGVSNMTFGGIYQDLSVSSSKNFINLFSIFLSIPIYFWILFKPIFKNNKKIIVFLLLSIFMILTNPQIRYTLILIPIMIVILAKEINQKQFKKQILISLFIIFLFITPYLIQINFSVNYPGGSRNGLEFTTFFGNLKTLQIKDQSQKEINIIEKDLEKIINQYPGEVFVVGNMADEYRVLAHLYWGEDVKEFVSIQDYNLVLKNETSLYEKKIMLKPNINTRRQIWIAGGINKNENDLTDYEKISYGIGLGEPIDIKDFEIVKKYDYLYLSKNKI